MKWFTVFLPHLASKLFVFQKLILVCVGLTVAVPVAAIAADSIVKKQKEKVPALSYTDKNEKSYQFDASGNKLTALHFWATWCVPCVEELPEIDAAQKKYADRGFKVIALSLDGKNVDKVEAFFKKNKISHLKPLFDVDMSAFRRLEIRGLPTTFFLDSKGTILIRKENKLDWQSKDVVDFIERHIK